ncbi:MAG TPA: alpha/beta hydrolase [Acidimicrobiales bacterium]|nr:alpha/beta hydrolase [Acidimicrobiales bacterium]
MLGAQPPGGREVVLPGRGTTWMVEAGGPQGAPTLLLFHGWSATAWVNWHVVLPDLARRYRVVAMDVRGHGRGIRPRGPFRLADCADDGAALCHHLGVGAVVAVGYSMGGAIAQLMWHRHRHRVRGLVLCSTAGLFGRRPPVPPPVKAAMVGMAQGLRALPRPLQAEVIKRALGNRDRPPWVVEERSASDLRCLVEAAMELNGFDGAGVLRLIDVPTAVVKTTADGVVDPARQQAMADAIPGAVVMEVDGGHDACVVPGGPFLGALLAACEAVTATP